MAAAAISDITVRVHSEGVERATAALDKLVRSEESLVRVTDSVTKSRERNEAAIDRIARKYDAEYRAAQDVDRATKQLDRARAAGLGQTEAFARATAALNRTQNDNVKMSALQRHEWINLSRQGQDVAVSLAGGQKPMTVLLQQGSQIADVFSSSRGGATAALKEFGAVATRALFSPIGIAATLAAGLLGVKAAGDAAGVSLAALGEKSRATGLSANEIAGMRIVGARAGLDDKESFGAMQTATRAFEQFSRNSGAVKGLLDNVDKGFLRVLDSSRGAAEWIDKVEQKIRALPASQGLELAKALFGEDQGRKLFEQIQQGAVSMSALRREAEKAGANFDVSATNAEKMKREIAEMDAIASTRLLATFGALADPVLAMERSWARMKLGILDVERSARQLRDTLRFNAGVALGEHGEAATSVFARMRQQRLGDPFAGKTLQDVDPLINLFTQGQKPRTVGEDRATFIKPDKARGGKSDAEREADAYQKITAELQGQIRLASSLGVEHDKISLQLKIQAEQAKLGANASAEHKAHVAELVTQLAEAQRSQEQITESARAMRDAYAGVANPLAGGLKSVLMGKAKPGDALQGVLETLQGSVFDAALTGSGPLSALFGTQGKDGAMGGIFGGIFEGVTGALGLGGGKAATKEMNVTATNVNVNGKGAAAGGLAGAAKGLIAQGVSALVSGIFSGFDGGGIVGAPGGHTVRAPISAFIGAPHFDLGGRVPGAGGPVPIIAHAGELILNAAQQHNTAVAIARGQNENRTVAAPVQVNLIGAPQGTKVQETRDSSGGRRIDVVMDERIAAAIGSPQGQEALQSANGMGRRVARR